jgi:hypothetical protein
MKPMVVSAAKARPAPRVLPSAIAALPCNRCRREILPKSMCLLPLADEPPQFRSRADTAELGGYVASFVPEHDSQSISNKILK